MPAGMSLQSFALQKSFIPAEAGLVTFVKLA